jgi:DNA-binding transcriptional ArsR family regulator
MNAKEERDLERLLKALANRRRIAILRFLKSTRIASVGDISSEIKVSLKATSKHLNQLAATHIIQKEQRGPHMLCSLAPDLPDLARRILSY